MTTLNHNGHEAAATPGRASDHPHTCAYCRHYLGCPREGATSILAMAEMSCFDDGMGTADDLDPENLPVSAAENQDTDLDDDL